ncbi:hypothetical protein [Pedococcus sp. P5_B7]
MRTSIRRAAIATLVSIGLAVATTASASADTKTSTSSTGSIIEWKLGGTYYYQGHTNDDFGLDVVGGIGIDARWASCSISGGTGATKYDITVAEGRRVLGTNFLEGSCVRVQYRGYSTTGTFSSTQHWNYNFA